MSTRCKRIKRILENPKNVSFDELDSVLSQFGWSYSSPKGSHYPYSHEGFRDIITVPFKRPFVNEHYVKQVIKILNLEEYYDENC